MAKKRSKIRSEDIRGLKYFKSLRNLIGRLHSVSTARDKAGNRELHMDQYCALILLWFFSPIVTSLRGLQQAGELDKVRKSFGVGRASLGSLSEGVAVFDPEPLKAIAQELFDQLPDISAGQFDVVGQRLIAVDGSVVKTLARVARLAWLRRAKGALHGYRLHTQFEDQARSSNSGGHGRSDSPSEVRHPQQRPCLRRIPPACHQSARPSRRADQPDLSAALADRDLLSDVQAVARLPASALNKAERCRDSGVLRHHCLPADHALHGPATFEANL